MARENHGLDTSERVYFYEREFYPLSNFSSFQVRRNHVVFMTSEHAYHFLKFLRYPEIQKAIIEATSAHEALQIARTNEDLIMPGWDLTKVDFMREILWDKYKQHSYVQRKLYETGTRELIENSWRDDFWGWGPNRDGKNQLGRLWMEIRAQVMER